MIYFFIFLKPSDFTHCYISSVVWIIRNYPNSLNDPKPRMEHVRGVFVPWLMVNGQ